MVREEFRKEFKEKNPKNKSVAAVSSLKTTLFVAEPILITL